MADFEGFLATLGGKERHEIRRKIRRAEAVGPIRLTRSSDPLADLPAFIDLHQKRWGAEGLFPATPGGAASRTFFGRLFELFGADGPLVLSFLPSVTGGSGRASTSTTDRRCSTTTRASIPTPATSARAS